MSRSYTLKKRAESQAETRRRIVEAAVELHGTLGPARTTISQIADRAGVQRKTYYAHFPDERALLLACSGLHAERHPFPDMERLSGIADAEKRLRAGLAALYQWYEANARLLSIVFRDAESHAPTREVAELRYAPLMARLTEVLAADLSPPQRGLLQLALAFPTWQTLHSEAKLGRTAAVDLMTRAIASLR